MANTSKFNWGVIGHSAQLALLERAVLNQTLAHGYIFSGPSSVGKMTVAKQLAKVLLCQEKAGCGSCAYCKTFSVGSNADYIEISGAEPIKVESIRDLSYRLALKPYAGQYKIAVIDNAHNLTVEASNALLKVLEEPKPNTLMILVTNNAYRLLPTIFSRAQKINFGPVPERETAPEQDDSFNQFISGSLGQKLIMAQELAERETPELKSLLDIWLKRLQALLRTDPSQDFFRKTRGVIRAQRMLDQNANSKLLLAELMVSTN